MTQLREDHPGKKIKEQAKKAAVAKSSVEMSGERCEEDIDPSEAKIALGKLETEETLLFANLSAAQREHGHLLKDAGTIAQSQVQKDGVRLRERAANLDLEIARLSEENRTVSEMNKHLAAELAREDAQNEPIRRKEEKLREEIRAAQHSLREILRKLPTFADTASDLRKHEALMHVHCENDSLARAIKVHEAMTADMVPKDSSSRRPSPRKARHARQIDQRLRDAQTRTSANICAMLRQRCADIDHEHKSRMEIISRRQVLLSRLERELSDLRVKLETAPSSTS
ncbi:Hypothetical Protein FCC1311_050032 [Hondaea fermentalgiana]|uniref:Uncharacterized protein n=1 Tax=Hondaea fermentalgiana TaxID=2315210 RepID=A0A2R5GCT3_9STRA|nr:Hypothetical Protein FCC1311_050032 [Hondaea fermentalgiana]|eukprot:GBG28782.1 Hypothetical Protein FCC1311_050032 [Hondaea fermentalgiana]